MNIYYIAAIWLGMALLASFISIRIGVSLALVEILVGAVCGNIRDSRAHRSNRLHDIPPASVLSC